ncbi:helix-turn-helix domain-containing protein [Virgisporangium aurantiacum]|uniref:HTH cro/C1-type domain-containing protein n=1 Tax=Virgisporangium aurantiacum TaxID=175570 RepID=A0A8J3ZIB8_9ACTN|nr:helix-turn-helix domain-containing protein [Virgisporangium aurantiacum]GIJ64774.1 hypothetical protein Vau01_122900 [Virgisporangium aurantiacum]
MTEGSDERPIEVLPNSYSGAHLRWFRQSAGMSLADLSAKTHYSRGYLSKIENCRVPFTREIGQACDGAIGAKGALLRLAVDLPVSRRKVVAVQPADLPPAARYFYGRDGMLGEIVRVLGRNDEDEPRSRVIALYGLPGAGKTELAIQIAGQVIDAYGGCLFVDLHGSGEMLSPDDVMNRVLRRLGLPGEVIPHDIDEQAALYRRTVRDRRLLLILDNAANVGQVQPLLPPGGRSDVLVTSRIRLAALDEAEHFRIEEISLPAAQRLFESISRIKPSAPADHALVDQIVDRCGRLPLAIRVAAALASDSSGTALDVLAGRLEDEPRLSALDDGTRSVGIAFESAFTMLPPELARALALLSLHPGNDFDHRAVALLTNASARHANTILDRLFDACLLGRTRNGRFAFHDLVRVFTSDLAEEPTNPDRDQLLQGFLHIAQHADLIVTPGRFRAPQVQPEAARWYAKFVNPAAAARWLDDEQHNLVRICEVAATERPDVCWRMAFALRDFFFRTKRWDPWIRTHRLALDAADRCADGWAVAVTLNSLGLAYAETGQFVLASEQYVRAMKIFQDMGDEYGAANTVGHQAWILHCRGRNPAAIRLGRRALQFYEDHHVARNAAITLRTIALAEAATGNFDTALEHLHRAHEIFVGESLVLDETMTLNCLGEVYAQAQDPARSRKHFRAARRLARVSGSTFEQARALRGLAAASAAVGHSNEAARLVDQAQSLHAGYLLIPSQAVGRRHKSGANQ